MRLFPTLLFCLLYSIFSIFQLLVLVLLSRSRIRSIYTRLDARETGRRIESLRSHIRAGDSMLDIGAGSGRFGQAVQEELGARVTGVDVVDYSDGTIPFQVYDGRTLPFAAKSFDVSCLAFVLHHTEDHAAVLGEAFRVTRRQVIVFEDTYDGFWERAFVCWNDFHTNVLQGWVKSKKGYMQGAPFRMPMPMTFRSVAEWQSLFRSLGVTDMTFELRKMGYKPLRKVVFRLRVADEGSAV